MHSGCGEDTRVKHKGRRGRTGSADAPAAKVELCRSRNEVWIEDAVGGEKN